MVAGSSLDEIVQVFRRTTDDSRDQILRETGRFQPSPRARKPGTVQAATWTLQRPSASQRLYVVVTHTPRPWAEDLVEPEHYALVAVADDRANQAAQLYAVIQQQLQLRARIRA